jgi:hypothetical protein
MSQGVDVSAYPPRIQSIPDMVAITLSEALQATIRSWMALNTRRQSFRDNVAIVEPLLILAIYDECYRDDYSDDAQYPLVYVIASTMSIAWSLLDKLSPDVP